MEKHLVCFDGTKKIYKKYLTSFYLTSYIILYFFFFFYCTYEKFCKIIKTVWTVQEVNMRIYFLTHIRIEMRTNDNPAWVVSLRSCTNNYVRSPFSQRTNSNKKSEYFQHITARAIWLVHEKFQRFLFFFNMTHD